MKREHSSPNGTVSVKMHKRKRLTLVVPREELDQALIERVEVLERENRILRRTVTEKVRRLREVRRYAEQRGGPYECSEAHPLWLLTEATSPSDTEGDDD